MFVRLFGDTREWTDYVAISPSFWAPEKVGLRQPILILSPCLGTPENAGVPYQFRPLLGPREGRVEAANSDFVPLFGDPQECRGSIAIPPSFGPPGRQG